MMEVSYFVDSFGHFVFVSKKLEANERKWVDSPFGLKPNEYLHSLGCRHTNKLFKPVVSYDDA